MRSIYLARASAAWLGTAGLALLFLSDQLLPLTVPGYPRNGVWLGQLLAAGWLGLASMNWLQRGLVLGGIYGRPLLLGNLTVHFVSASSVLGTIIRDVERMPLLVIAIPSSLLALAYARLLLRGPFAADAVPFAETGAL